MKVLNKVLNVFLKIFLALVLIIAVLFIISEFENNNEFKNTKNIVDNNKTLAIGAFNIQIFG
jgi:flagellar biogenesis protein FliO